MHHIGSDTTEIVVQDAPADAPALSQTETLVDRLEPEQVSVFSLCLLNIEPYYFHF